MSAWNITIWLDAPDEISEQDIRDSLEQWSSENGTPSAQFSIREVTKA